MFAQILAVPYYCLDRIILLLAAIMLGLVLGGMALIIRGIFHRTAARNSAASACIRAASALHTSRS